MSVRLELSRAPSQPQPAEEAPGAPLTSATAPAPGAPQCGGPHLGGAGGAADLGRAWHTLESGGSAAVAVRVMCTDSGVIIWAAAFDSIVINIAYCA